MATSNITIRMDSELKRQGEELFEALGLSMTAAITAFVKQAVREQAIPFRLSRNTPAPSPNPLTIQAFQEIEEMKKSPQDYKSYKDAQELFQEILA
ncbi:MAG: type II toxin-antitoxin system RelB/DinJ family antitoxin [Spirochaetaceae bacterium]|nr:type II toxin-antitoxin system RelB/DinJ family antitoxin [Spirochaetaceae bacterium]MBQ8385744.1 type II toxin-antitoxin system RelB/DinJ family antitoxin [Spirochaetaceae bacterium]